MVNELIQIIGLGIAGIDPFGAILLFSVIHARAEQIKVIVLTSSIFITTVLAGVVITFASTHLVENTLPETSSKLGPIWAYLEIGVAALIGYWLFRRFKSSNGFEEKDKEKKPPRGTLITYVFAGIVFSATAVIDPTFLGVAVVVADTNNLLLNITAFTFWTLISQFMLFTLFVTYLTGSHQQLTNYTMSLWQRNKQLFWRLLQASGVIAVLLLLADSSYYIINGTYFPY